MGNAITKENDTINWNNLKTENFSESRNYTNLSSDSKLLLSKLQLNIPNLSESETDSINIENIFSKYQATGENNAKLNSSDLSETSPFISSDMYNYLMNKNNTQSGGAKKGKGKKHRGGAIVEDSSTSSTSSSSDMKSSDSERKPKGKKVHNGKSRKVSEDLTDNLSYISSSAHTSEDGSETASSAQSGGNSTVSNGNDDIPPSSINTSDINMVTENSS